MNVLVITGDKNFKEGHPRFNLQKSVVQKLAAVYWGRGSLWPKIPRDTFDIVTAQDPFLRGLFAWFCARRLRAKFNVQVHTDLSAQSFFRHVLCQIVLRHADSIRVVSEKIKGQVQNMGIQAPICVLPIFVDIPKFSSVVRREHPRERILWLGRFEKEKDPLTAISVLDEVRKTGMDAELVMLGEGKMTKMVIKNANNKPILHPGWGDTITYLETADVVLCTSLHESWGASIVEALAAGIPVVAPDVGIAREAGAIVVPRAQLAEAVISVLSSNPKPEGELKLSPIENPTEWAMEWKKCLLPPSQ